MYTDVKTTLQNITFLKDFPEKYLDEIAGISRFHNYKGGDTVFREGDDADTLYLIVSGEVSLKVGTGEAGEKQIVTLGTGEMLGWSSLTRHPQFAATAVAEGDARIVEIDGARVRAFCDADPKFGYEFMGRTVLALSKRLIATWTQLADVYVTHYAPVTVGSAARNE